MANIHRKHTTMTGKIYPTADLGQASIPAIKQYLQLAELQQLDIASLLAELDITAEILADNGQHVPGLKFQQLIARLIALSKDELFGLHTARFVQPGSYSVLGYIIMNCDSLGEAITKIQPFEKLVGDMGTTSFDRHGSDFKISWQCRFSDPLVRRHMIDNCLASWLTFAHYLTDKDSHPSAVWLTREIPSWSEQQEYQERFGCQVLFNQTTNSILFSESHLALPLNKGNKQLLSTLESHANDLIENLSDSKDVISQVKYLIKLNLEKRHFHQLDIAKLMSMSGKTLQRRLKDRQTNFQFLLDEVRMNQANELLENSPLKLNQIGFKLGFNEPRSFYRWFQKLTKQTPGEYRKTIRR